MAGGAEKMEGGQIKEIDINHANTFNYNELSILELIVSVGSEVGRSAHSFGSAIPEMGGGGGREAQNLHNHLKAPFNLNCMTSTVGGNQNPRKKERTPERKSDLGPPHRCPGWCSH